MKKLTTFIVITWVVSALIIGCLVSSCSAVKQNQRQHRKIQKAKELLKEYKVDDDFCAENFPVKEEYIKGDTVVHFDTLYVEGIIYDTVTLNDTVYITRSLPGKVINRTFTITDTVIKENTAKSAMLQGIIDVLKIENGVLQGKLSDTKAERDEWKKKARKRNWLLITLAAVFIGWQFRGKIFPLISKLLK